MNINLNSERTVMNVGDKVKFEHHLGSMVIVGTVKAIVGDRVVVVEDFAASVWGESDNMKGVEHNVARDRVETKYVD
jgi:hypothetical protein